MRKSIVILALLLSSITYKSYSQNISAPLLKEINQALAEGLEAKRLLIEKDDQIAIQMDLLQEHYEKNRQLTQQVALLKENGGVYQAQANAAMEQVQQCNADKEKAERDANRLRKARNRYAWIAGIETVVLAAIVYLSIR